jgi:hypothetical protein
MSQLGLGLGLTRGGGVPFNPLSLNPYLLFDTRSSMIGTFENPTLDLDPSDPDTLDVITATRSGVATYTDEDGLIQSASADTVRVDYTQGEELTPTKFQRVENTDFSNWSHARTSDTANAAISPDGQNNATYLEQNTGETNAGSIYRSDSSFTGVFTLSVYAKKKEKDFVVLYDSNTGRTYFNLDTGTVGTVHGGNTAKIEDAGDGWFRCSVTFTASSGTVKAFYVGDTDNSTVVTDSGGIYIYGPQLEEGTTASDFVANTTGSPKFITGATYGPRVPMILVEPSATNGNQYSEDATQWGGSNRTVTPNTTTAPDGNQTAATIVRTAGGGDIRGTGQSVTAGVTYSMSVFAKAETDALIRLDVSNSTFGGGDVTFNARTGEQTAGDTTKASVEVFPNGWRRFVFTPTCQVTGTSNIIIRLDNDEPVQLWGFQFEQGSVATSYIPALSGSTVTRAADDLVISGSDFTDFYNGSEGTFYVESALQRETEASFQPFLFSADNGDANRLGLYYASGGGGVRGFVRVSNVEKQLSFGAHPAVDTLSRTAFSYKTNNLRGSIDGSSVTPLTNVAIPTTVSKLDIGSHLLKYQHLWFNGHIKRFIYWPLHSDSL